MRPGSWNTAHDRGTSLHPNEAGAMPNGRARNHGDFSARGRVEVTRVAMRHDPVDVSSRTIRFESAAVALEIG